MPVSIKLAAEHWDGFFSFYAKNCGKEILEDLILTGHITRRKHSDQPLYLWFGDVAPGVTKPYQIFIEDVGLVQRIRFSIDEARVGSLLHGQQQRENFNHDIRLGLF